MSSFSKSANITSSSESSESVIVVPPGVWSLGVESLGGRKDARSPCPGAFSRGLRNDSAPPSALTHTADRTVQGKSSALGTTSVQAQVQYSWVLLYYRKSERAHDFLSHIHRV